MTRMFRILCVCIFVAKYTNGFHINSNEDELKRKLLSYFDHFSWEHDIPDPGLRIGPSFDPAFTIIQNPKIERTYVTEIRVQQASHPYLFSLMQMIPIKVQIPFEYVYEKLFRYFMAMQRFKPYQIVQILQYVFPELSYEQINYIASYPLGPGRLKALFEIIFPGLSAQDLNLIFAGAHTTPEVLINLLLYLCPSIKQHIMWRDDLPPQMKLDLILDALFPGVYVPKLLKENNPTGDFQNNIYTFMDLLFQGRLTPNTPKQEINFEGPEWLEFQNALYQNQINMKYIPKDFLFYLFSRFHTPEFQQYLLQIKEKYPEQQPYQMDPGTLKIWQQYLFELKTHEKTLNDMPPEIKVFLKQHNNPKELIKIISNTLGYEVDASKLDIPLDPQIMELWQKFIFDILNHKGDTTHLPKPLLDYFYSLSKNPNYKNHLDVIFDSLSINPQLAIKWNTFFDQLQEGHTTLDQMPKDLTIYLTHYQHPEEFLRLILKLKDSNINTNFLNIDTNPEMMNLWKKYIEDVAENKGNLRNIPPELLQYFYQIASNPTYVAYIKLLFAPDRINPETLNIWNDFIGKLKTHQVDLKDMPTELIQLMLKYKSPDEFFKVLLPQHNINAIPNETVKEQWKDWTSHLQDHNGSVYDTPKELKDYFYQVSPSKDYQTTLNQIYAINPDLLKKWKAFMSTLRAHEASLQTIPEDLKPYILEMKSPKEFVNLIFNGMEHPLNAPIPEPSEEVLKGWGKFLGSLQENPTLMKYLRNVSPNANYKQEVSNIFQIDPSLKSELNSFKNKMKKDYDVSISNLPMNVVNSLHTNFLDPVEGFTSIIASYPGNHDLKPRNFTGLNMDWAKLINTFGPRQSDIDPINTFVIKYITKDSMLEPEIDEVFKLHESNRLISKTEKLWKKTKQESEVHDGVEVFIQFLDQFGDMYGNTEELCEERLRILEALDKMRNKFASRSNCTYKELLKKALIAE